MKLRLHIFTNSIHDYHPDVYPFVNIDWQYNVTNSVTIHVTEYVDTIRDL